jgi:PAS domain-containing protein
VRARHNCKPEPGRVSVRNTVALVRTEASQRTLLDSAGLFAIATGAKGFIRIFNAGAERMLGCIAADAVGHITLADIADPLEVIARARGDQQFYTRSFIEVGVDVLVVTDARRIVTDANKQSEALTECRRAELITSAFKDYFAKSARAQASIKRVLSEGKATNSERTPRTTDDSLTVVAYNASTFLDRNRHRE